ncbi:hypothetical protein BLNAU_22506 [Blattamonas nauphoetae]|uniref:Uncharacterized protein n=1 Tax=Blattamonas nauphoetae TaxID=2049346 RepID=A0ABQ9WSW0_9EUKA|nr:hypothetical protein BLNAU_22506 [Blattamonas nauphoetae]
MTSNIGRWYVHDSVLILPHLHSSVPNPTILSALCISSQTALSPTSATLLLNTASKNPLTIQIDTVPTRFPPVPQLDPQLDTFRIHNQSSRQTTTPQHSLSTPPLALKRS